MQVVCKEPWMCLCSIGFKKKNGEMGTWDFCLKPRKLRCLEEHHPKNATSCCIDGVAILPIIKRADRRDIVLVAEYRYPLQTRIVSMAGGLVDEGEDVSITILRELKEETGYVSDAEKIYSWSPRVSVTDPWKSLETEMLTVVEIDGTKLENQSPEQSLELEENITVLVIPNLGPNTIHEVVALCQKYNMQLGSNVARFLLGIRFGCLL